ncbi:MAG: integrase [Bacteroidales bacterium 45-6]|nr:MAG: integrase [Bacteroidales bacterium 45-6]
MNASVSIICYKQKTLSNGENPLMLRICKDGKRTYQSLGISISPQLWDFKKNEPKLKCPDRERIISIILKKKEAIQKKILEFNSEEKDYTVNSLLGEKQQNIRCSVEEYYLQLIRQYEETNNRGNRRVYKSSLNSLLSFSKNKLNITFQEINVNWLEKYEKWLRAKKNKETTISLLFRTLRSAYNKAIEDKCAKKAQYPFNEYKLSKFDVSTQKRAISKSDIMKIKNLDLTGQRFYIRFSRDMFIFSYLCSGINFTDISNLILENLSGNFLHYKRQKTGKNVKVSLLPDARNIIETYKNDSGYLFPILDRKIHETSTQKENRIHKVLGHVDRNLKKVAKLAQVDTTLTTYVARHSFATILKKSGVNIALIGEALGHSDIATTQIYLDSFDSEQVDEAMKNLL